MNDKGLEMLNDFELKDNDEEDDKLSAPNFIAIIEDINIK